MTLSIASPSDNGWEQSPGTNGDRPVQAGRNRLRTFFRAGGQVGATVVHSVLMDSADIHTNATRNSTVMVPERSNGRVIENDVWSRLTDEQKWKAQHLGETIAERFMVYGARPENFGVVATQRKQEDGQNIDEFTLVHMGPIGLQYGFAMPNLYGRGPLVRRENARLARSTSVPFDGLLIDTRRATTRVVLAEVAKIVDPTVPEYVWMAPSQIPELLGVRQTAVLFDGHALSLQEGAVPRNVPIHFRPSALI